MKVTTEELTNVEELTEKIIKNTTLHISKIEDEDLLILKGHLLIESALRDYCKSKTIKHDAFDKAKLSFSQLLHLAQALKGELENEKWLWGVLKNINTLRNQTAHQLDNQESFESNKFKLFNSFNPKEILELKGENIKDFYRLKHILIGTYASLVIELQLTKQIITNIFIDSP